MNLDYRLVEPHWKIIDIEQVVVAQLEPPVG